jgi:ribonuclease P/MRP protein subunit POP1
MPPDTPKPPSKKRKLPSFSNTTTPHQPRKRKTLHDLRQIPTQPVDAALRNGELDVGRFVAAREYEIKALESGMVRARKGLNTRAFQEVPRDMRRRTASHNVKKVPKRLRARAKKEVCYYCLCTGREKWDGS